MCPMCCVVCCAVLRFAVNSVFSEDDSDPFGEQTDYYYYYSFCTDLSARPLTRPANVCDNSTAMGNTYQISNSTRSGLDTACRVVSRANNVSYDLIDPENPAIGLYVHYSNGTLCGGNNPRDLLITLYCNKVGPVARTSFGKVSEDNPCDYSTIVSSIAGCPIGTDAPHRTAQHRTVQHSTAQNISSDPLSGPLSAACRQSARS
jgi:hypothetical protein